MLSPMKVKIIPITGMIATQPMTSIVEDDAVWKLCWSHSCISCSKHF
jgi:hypothetical protein